MADDVRETLSAGFRAGKHHRFPRVQLGASRGARCSWKNQNQAPRYFFDRVRRGELTPEEAEHEAQKKEIGPLATAPDPVEFDPDEMPWRPLPMALSWISWRNSERVRQHCAEYRETCSVRTPGSWNVPTSDAAEFARIDGYELRKLGRSTVVRLSISEICLSAYRDLP
jgi:hypothetical protein